jgi:hypothetical protein
MENLPREILINVINQLEGVNIDNDIDDDDNNFFLNIDIDFILSLRLINKEMNNIITSLTGAWKYIPYKKYSIDYSPLLFTNVDKEYINTCKKRSNEVGRFCGIKTVPQSTFKWLMDNNISFSLINICELIKNNRLDIILLGFHYGDFLNMLFNRFYMNNETTVDHDYLFTSTYSLNPIIVAAENNRVNIIKVLLESSSVANPFIKEIPCLFDISIKLCYKKLLNYIIIYHYDKISDVIDNKISKVLYRFDNCEDIIFYLISTDKIKLNEKLLIGCIAKSYNNLFIYIYKKGVSKINYNDLIKKTIEYNNYIILSYLIEIDGDFILNKETFTKSLIKRKNINKEFLETVILNNIELISKEYEIITSCINIGVDNKVIFNLVDNGYNYSKDDLYKPLDDGNIELLKHLVNNL